VVLQIETRRALEAREELLAVPGIDAVMIGPADLSISLGVPGEFQHPKMVEAMEAVRDSCVKRGIAPGTQTRSAALAKFGKSGGCFFWGVVMIARCCMSGRYSWWGRSGSRGRVA